MRNLYVPCLRCCWPCIGRKRVGKILRCLIIISDILRWFVGCTIFSISIWLRFVDTGARMFYATFHPLETSLYVLLVVSILYLVISFVGICAANTRNERLILMHIAISTLLLLGEIAALIMLSQYFSEIEQRFSDWYKEHFMKYQETSEQTHRDIVNHVQSKMKCCGLYRPTDYVNLFTNLTIPATCMDQSVVDYDIIRPEIYSKGCLDKLYELIVWLYKGVPAATAIAVIFFLQVTGICTSHMYLVHIYYREEMKHKEDGVNSNSSQAITRHRNTPDGALKQKKKINIEELPLPKVYRIIRNYQSTFGITLRADSSTKRQIVDDIIKDSVAEFAGLLVGSQIVEMNGFMLQGTTTDEVHEIMNDAVDELRLVVVDKKTQTIYKSNKVAVNLKNVEGVTNGEFEYKPRLVKLEKAKCGFGFHLLYLEDRQGEYIEDIAQGSPAFQAGLKIGDRIVEVNSVNVENDKSCDVVKHIRMSGDKVELLVVDPKTDGYYRKKGVTVTASLTDGYFEEKLGSISELPAVNRDYPYKVKVIPKREVKPRFCMLGKSAKEDFGLYVVIDNKRIGLVIRWIDCGGPADKSGLQIGDRIIEVNGHSVEYECHKRLISCLSLNPTETHFLVVDEDYDRAYKRNKPRLCHIFKENDSFGFDFRYAGRKDGNYVDKIEGGGPADRAGLKVGDRLIQISGMNIEHKSQSNVMSFLETFDEDIILLVIDSRSNKHYKKITEFKTQEIGSMDYDKIPISEPIFLPDKEEKRNSGAGIMNDYKIMNKEEETKEDSDNKIYMLSGESLGTVEDDKSHSQQRKPRKTGQRAHANKSVKQKITNQNEVANESRNENRPILFRLTRSDGGYGFYLWNDDNGHYVEHVTIGSPADRVGMRSGDRIIEVNGVNVEEETHKEVFYRVKACLNVVTLLSVDLKTFNQYKRNNISIIASKAESRYSGNTVDVEDSKSEKQVTTLDLTLHRREGEDFGFHLAFSNSFIEEAAEGEHVVHWVQAGGCAEDAGLRDGDKIIAVDDTPVINEEHDMLIQHLYKPGKYVVNITVEREDCIDSYTPHTISIQKIDNALGLHLWFDEFCHYIEDVTIGSAADIAGLKVGDVVLEVNGKNVEHEYHADVVSLVRESEEVVNLLVVSVRSQQTAITAKRAVHKITKRFGTFGFTILQDGKGFYIDFVDEESPADKSGIRIGDRLLEVDGEVVSDLQYDDVVKMIRFSGNEIILAVMSTGEPRFMGDVPKLEAESSHFNPNQLLVHKDLGKNNQAYSDLSGDLEMKSMQVDLKNGADNSGFRDEENNDDKPTDPEGRYLEAKIARMGEISTQRRTHVGSYAVEADNNGLNIGYARRKRNLKNIEKKFANVFNSDERKTLRKKEKTPQKLQQRTDPAKLQYFHMPTSTILKNERWNFEKTDSRTPGDVQQVVVDMAMPDNLSVEE